MIPARLLRLLAALVVLPCAGRSTSVRAPEFSELVSRADSVVRAKVTGVRSEWRGRDETRRIVTLVTFRVERVLIGQAPPMLELEFLGGQVGDDRFEISGMPVFKVGDKDILFVERNGRQLCPLVGFTHGRYLIVEGAAQGESATVARNNSVPLESVDEIVLPLAEGLVVQSLKRLKRAPLTVSQFEAAIVDRALTQGRRDVQLRPVQ